MNRWIGVWVGLCLALSALFPPFSAADEPATTVGRVYYIKGSLLRFIDAEQDWVAVVKDAPFTTGDTFYTGSQGRAELIVPNGTWVRMGKGTQMQFIALYSDLSETDVASGVARFYNKSSHTVVKSTCPFGYVLADPGAVFDFYVGENSVEVVALGGKVGFIHSATNARYEVSAGSSSILADRQLVVSGEGTVDPEWDRWNARRENFWAAKTSAGARSAEYLPHSLHYDAHALDENGTWENVYYQGQPCWVWRPIAIGPGWSPFTVGRWTDWYGDLTWIPAEPFGYLTHHYGNWIYLNHRWCWAPPVAVVSRGLPLLNVGFFWYPGRVSWIHHGTHVGWIPLSPHEPYYCHRNWGGPHTIVVNQVNITRIHVDVRNYTYVSQAIVVNRDHFFGVRTYRNVRVTDMNQNAIVSRYRAAPVINDTVITDYRDLRQRFNFTTARVNEKPHLTVINRIRQNERVIHEGRRENPVLLREQVKKIPEGRPDRLSRIEAPKAMNYLVPADQMNRPKSELRLPPREIKGRGEDPAATRIERPETRQPERSGPALQVQPAPVERPGRIAPPRPAQPGQPPVTDKPESQPSRPEQVRPERQRPVVPAPQLQPAPIERRERNISPKPVSPGQPPAAGRPEPQPPRTEQVRPEQQRPAGPQPKPVEKPERITPPRPVPQGQPPAMSRPLPPPLRPEQPRPERLKPEGAGKPAELQKTPEQTKPPRSQEQPQEKSGQQERPR
ncbi:MAG: hypothetical protein HY879_00555 [Deltaproteobacteria bacterium]|nr:hypothetical protein [Deltaproteobacteria bacterium]